MEHIYNSILYAVRSDQYAYIIKSIPYISELVHLSFDLCDKSYMISFNSPIYNMYN